MGKIICEECKKEYDDTNKVCPNCGYERNKKKNKLKFIIPVIVLFLLIILIIVLLNHNSKTTQNITEEKEETISVGDTITTDYYEITLTSIGYADSTIIPTELQAKLCSITSESFLLPLSTNEADLFSEDGYEILSATDGNTLLYFSFDYKFVGKEDTEYPAYFGANVTLSYLDYTFNSTYYIAYRTVLDGETDEWHSLTSTSSINRSISFYNASSMHHPFENYTMEARGFIAIPDEITEDESSVISLTINETYSELHVTIPVDQHELDNKCSE